MKNKRVHQAIKHLLDGEHAWNLASSNTLRMFGKLSLYTSQQTLRTFANKAVNKKLIDTINIEQSKIYDYAQKLMQDYENAVEGRNTQRAKELGTEICWLRSGIQVINELTQHTIATEKIDGRIYTLGRYSGGTFVRDNIPANIPVHHWWWHYTVDTVTTMLKNDLTTLCQPARYMVASYILNPESFYCFISCLMDEFPNTYETFFEYPSEKYRLSNENLELLGKLVHLVEAFDDMIYDKYDVVCDLSSLPEDTRLETIKKIFTDPLWGEINELAQKLFDNIPNYIG
ncbi:MAG: hypothetical protein H6679_05640 [Epsilonproteobacteria bacterium]|nr:hypothetical protein [Campylobacterota bacterium]